jgi:hypothetical protein
MTFDKGTKLGRLINTIKPRMRLGEYCPVRNSNENQRIFAKISIIHLPASKTHLLFQGIFFYALLAKALNAKPTDKTFHGFCVHHSLNYEHLVIRLYQSFQSSSSSPGLGMENILLSKSLNCKPMLSCFLLSIEYSASPWRANSIRNNLKALSCLL